MTYVDPFNATLISGNTQAKLIDDTFRSMHRALIERLNDKLVVDATADPWVLKDSLVGRKVGKTAMVPFIDFHSLGGGNTTISLDRITCLATANALVAPVIVPNGVTITRCEIAIETTVPLAWSFYKVTIIPPFTRIIIAADTHSVLGQGNIGSAILSELTDQVSGYCISLDTLGSSVGVFSVYGARVTYDTPSHLNTI